MPLRGPIFKCFSGYEDASRPRKCRTIHFFIREKSGKTQGISFWIPCGHPVGQTHLVFGKRVCTCVTKHSNAFRTFLNWLKNSKRVWHQPKLHILRLPIFANFDINRNCTFCVCLFSQILICDLWALGGFSFGFGFSFRKRWSYPFERQYAMSFLVLMLFTTYYNMMYLSTFLWISNTKWVTN